MSRGPDDRDLALRRNTAALLAVLDLQEQLERVLGELHESERACESVDLVPARAHFAPAMHAAWQVERGEAFWDRQPVEPVP